MLFGQSTCHHVQAKSLFLEQTSCEERALDSEVLKHPKPYLNAPVLLMLRAQCGVIKATVNSKPISSGVN